MNKPSCTTVAKLLAVKEAILKHPKEFDMDSWYGEKFSINMLRTSCNTTGCMAGWAVALDKKMAIKTCATAYADDEYNWDMWDMGMDALGITYNEADRLFFTEEWPEEFGRAYHSARTNKGRAKVTARRIDHFIATGE